MKLVENGVQKIHEKILKRRKFMNYIKLKQYTYVLETSENFIKQVFR